MKKFVKFFIYLIILLLIVVVSIPYLFKGKIVEMTKEEINNNVNAKVDFGDFDLTIFHSFPDLTFYIKDVSVVGVDTFSADTLMYIGKLALDMDLMSVLSSPIKIKSVSVDNPVIHAIVLKNGQANWDIVPEDTVAAEEEAEASSESPFALALKSFSIDNAEIVYDDADLGVYKKMEGMNFSMSGDFTESTTNLDMTMHIKSLDFKYDGMQYLKQAIVDFKALISANLDKSIYTFKDNELVVNDLPLKFDGVIEMPADDIVMDIRLGSKGNFKKLLSLVPSVFLEGYENVKVKGDFDFEASMKGTYNDSLMPAYDMKLLVSNGYVKYPDLPEDIKDIAVNLNIYNKDSADLNKTIVDLKKFHMDIAGNPVDAKLVTSNVMVDPYIDAYLKTHLDLASLKKAIPLDSTDLTGIIDADVTLKGKTSSLENEKYDEFDASGSLKIADLIYKTNDNPVPLEINTMTFEFAPQYLYLKEFVAKAGQTDIAASGKILNFLQYYFKDSLLKGEFNLRSNVIDINQWLTGEETVEGDTSANATEDTSALEVIEVPKNIDFTLNADIKKLFYDQMAINNIKGRVKVCCGAVKMENLSLDMLGGKVVMTGEYNTADITNPFVSYGLNITGLDIHQTYLAFETLKKVAPVLKNSFGKMSGTLELSMNLLQDMSPKMETMNGFGNIRTQDLVIKETGIFKFMNSFFKTDKFKELRPKNTNLSIKIENGKITVSPFDLKVGNTDAHLQGEQYVDGKMNYVIDWTMPREALGSVGVNALNDLAASLSKNGIELGDTKTLSFKTLILGTVDKPEYKVALGDQTSNVVDDVKQQVEDKVKEEIDKKKQEAIKKAREEAAKLLAEANKRAQQIRDEAHKQAEKIRAEGRNAAKKIREEAKKQGDELIRKAKNPIAKKAARVTAEKMRKEADKKANRVEKEANAKADKLEREADARAKKLIDDAKKKGDELIKKAENS